MITKILKAPFKPFKALFSSEPRGYEMKRRRRSRFKEDAEDKLSDQESEIFEHSLGDEVLESGYERGTVKMDVNDRESDLNRLHAQIRSHWKSYKQWLEQAKGEEGINETKAKTKAKQAKKAAKDKEKIYKLLWMELDSLKDALRKDEHIHLMSGGKYEIDFSKLNGANVEKSSEKYQQFLNQRQMTVEQFRNAVDRMDEDVEVDFSDIEKDVQELEMQDVEVFFEEEGGQEFEEPVPETGEDWS